MLEETIHSLKGHRIVFTHGDLNAWNILVKDNLEVVVVDWGVYGFFPVSFRFLS